MKKLLLLFSIVLITNSCDDGDIKLESFNFSSQSIAKCSLNAADPFLYKIKDKELLLLDVPESIYTYDTTQTTFPYTKTYTISTTYAVIYRLYSDTVASGTICSTIAPAIPIVTNEWNTTGGTIEVITNQRFDSDGITVIGYTHSMYFKNISFANATNSFSFEEYFFGDYQTTN